MRLHRPADGFKGVYPGSFHLIIPQGQLFKCLFFGFTNRKDLSQAHGQLIGLLQLRVKLKKNIGQLLLTGCPFARVLE